MEKNYSSKVGISIFSYIFASLLIIDCRCQWGYLSNTPPWWFNIKSAVLIMTIVLLLVRIRQVKLNNIKLSLFILTLMICYLLLYVVLQDYSRGTVIRLMAEVGMILVFILCTRDTNYGLNVLYSYQNLVLVIAIISIFFWLFGSIFAIIKPTGIVYTSWTGDNLAIKSYYHLYYENQTSTLGGLIDKSIRNSAIFTEGPMASFHFSTALLIGTLLNYKFNRISKIILITAIVTTLSGTGIVFFIILYMSKYCISSPKYKFLKQIRILMIPILLIVTFTVVVMIVSAKLSVSSGIIRVDDFIVCIRAWKKHKLLGGGIKNNDYIKSFMGTWRNYNQGISNSPGRILADGGLYISVLYLICFIGGIYNSIMSKNKHLIIAVFVFLYLFIFTIISYQYITFYFIIWFIASDQKIIKENKCKILREKIH